MKSKRNNTKQTVQFKLEDITSYKKTKLGQLRCLPKNAPYQLVLFADSATLKLDNQKADGKGCVFARKRMGRQFIAQSGPSDGESYTYANREQQSQASYPRFITTEKSLM